MQLAHAAGVQSHVYAGQRFRNRKFTNRNLARPSARVDPLVRKPERILKSRHQTFGIGPRWPH